MFRPPADARVIDILYGAVVSAARHPALYADLAIPDTFEGRFECLTLHAAIVLYRLTDDPCSIPDRAQRLVDTVFRHFDRTLREMGVGDMAVPKRMKTMAVAFGGRCAAYGDALRAEVEAEILEHTLARNVYAGCHDGVALSRYVRAGVAQLAGAPLRAVLDGVLPFPDPSAYLAYGDRERRTRAIVTIGIKASL